MFFPAVHLKFIIKNKCLILLICKHFKLRMYAVCACVGMFICMWTPINMCEHTCGGSQEIPGISITLLNQGLLAEPRGHPLTGICLCLLLGGVNIRSYG